MAALKVVVNCDLREVLGVRFGIASSCRPWDMDHEGPKPEGHAAACHTAVALAALVAHPLSFALEKVPFGV